MKGNGFFFLGSRGKSRVSRNDQAGGFWDRAKRNWEKSLWTLSRETSTGTSKEPVRLDILLRSRRGRGTRQRAGESEKTSKDQEVATQIRGPFKTQ